MLRLVAYVQAGQELTKTLDHKSILMNRLVFREAVGLMRHTTTPKFMVAMAEKGLSEAITGSRVFFGPRHELTRLLKENLESFRKQAAVTPIGKNGQS